MRRVEEEVEDRDEGTHKSIEDSKERVEDATMSLNVNQRGDGVSLYRTLLLSLDDFWGRSK